MEALSTNIQLIIKAPNQNVEDQVVHCDLDWSIKKLKIHLSAFYPNKPAVPEQKLIYSGRLLHDHLLLKDILRHEDRQAPTHIFHLVCSRQNNNAEIPQDMEEQSSHIILNDQNVPSNPESIPINETSPQPEIGIGLRQRVIQHTTPESSLGPQPFPQFIQAGAPVPDLSANSEFIAAQMAAMQQMYASYVAQYMQNMQIAQPLPNISSPAAEIPQNPPPVNNHDNNDDAAVPQIPRNRNLRMNAQGGPVLDDNDEMGNRDWLDYFYLCCRGFVLFSIVYFYSSPERLMLVIALALLAFFYQEGWFLARARNNRILENRQNRPPQPRNPQEENQNNIEDESAHNQNRDIADVGLQNEHEIEAAMDGDEPLHVQNPNVTDNTRVYPAWTFISSFFSSLIPDQPAPVNIN